MIKHFIEIDKQMSSQFEHLMLQCAKLYGIDEELKEINPIKWVQEMNNLKHSVEEKIISEYIKQ